MYKFLCGCVFSFLLGRTMGISHTLSQKRSCRWPREDYELAAEERAGVLSRHVSRGGGWDLITIICLQHARCQALSAAH